MLDHRDGFMETLRAGPEMRRRIFASLEQRYAQDFASGAVGRTLYETLHSAVADADVPGALAEFESRFLPLVNGRRLPNQTETGPAEAADEGAPAPGGRGRQWGWIAAIIAVVVVAGGLVVGLSTFNTILAKHSIKSKPVPDVQVTEPAPRRMPSANPIRTIDDNQEPSAEPAPSGSRAADQ
jgi:hypothetical protein